MVTDNTKYKIYYIEWVDSSFEGGWNPSEKEDYGKLVVVYTVGYLIHKNDEMVVVSSGYTTEGELLSTQKIPRCSIKKMKRLKT